MQSILPCPQDHIDENGNFPCRYCDKKKPKYEEISKHIYMIHWEHRSSGCKKPKKDKGKTWKCYYCKKTFLREKILREHRKLTHTGKSLSEALILGSTNPQYDKRLFIYLPVQYMKTTSSEDGEIMLCTQIVFLFLF